MSLARTSCARHWVISALLACLAACGGGGSSNSNPAPPAVVNDGVAPLVNFDCARLSPQTGVFSLQPVGKAYVFNQCSVPIAVSYCWYPHGAATCPSANYAATQVIQPGKTLFFSGPVAGVNDPFASYVACDMSDPTRQICDANGNQQVNASAYTYLAQSQIDFYQVLAGGSSSTLGSFLLAAAPGSGGTGTGGSVGSPTSGSGGGYAAQCLQVSTDPSSGSVKVTNACNVEITYSFCNALPDTSGATIFQCKAQPHAFSPTGYIYDEGGWFLAPGASDVMLGSNGPSNAAFVAACVWVPGAYFVPFIVGFNTPTITSGSQFTYICR